jgi:hypothetical protein
MNSLAEQLSSCWHRGPDRDVPARVRTRIRNAAVAWDDPHAVAPLRAAAQIAWRASFRSGFRDGVHESATRIRDAATAALTQAPPVRLPQIGVHDPTPPSPHFWLESARITASEMAENLTRFLHDDFVDDHFASLRRPHAPIPELVIEHITANAERQHTAAAGIVLAAAMATTAGRTHGHALGASRATTEISNWIRHDIARYRPGDTRQDRLAQRWFDRLATPTRQRLATLTSLPTPCAHATAIPTS